MDCQPRFQLIWEGHENLSQKIDLFEMQSAFCFLVIHNLTGWVHELQFDFLYLPFNDVLIKLATNWDKFAAGEGDAQE